MKHHTLLALSLMLLATTACATTSNTPAPEGLPNTDIHVADLSIHNKSLWLGELQPVAVSEGYDNQPAFLPDGRNLLFSSEGASGKTDLWQHDLVTGTRTQITNTPDRSEYSPRLTPDRQAISFIQEDPAGEVTKVYSQSLSGADASPLIALKPLGYYAFLNQGETVLTFLRSEPPSLQRVSISSGKTSEVATNIGRALYTLADSQTAFFTTLLENETYQINRYDDDTGQSVPLFKLPEGIQDYVVFKMPKEKGNGFFCADGTTLLFRTDAPGDDWRAATDYAASGISSITRLAVNRQATRLAVVTQQSEP